MKNISKNYNEAYNFAMGILKRINIEQITFDLLAVNKDSQNIVTLPSRVDAEESNDFKAIFNCPPNKDNNNLYVHIPYCTGICTYCSYVRKAVSPNRTEVFEDYLDKLEKEAAIQNKIFGIRPKISSIYLGGGTPTILSTKQLTRLCKIISKFYQWNNGIEFTLEGCPETITPEKLYAMKEFGCNRVSLGIESFNDNVLKNVNRRHTRKSSLQIIEKIRYIIPNIDIDILSNLPGSTPEIVYDDAITCNELEMPSVQLYHFHKKPKSISSKQEFTPDPRDQVLKWGIFDYVMAVKGDYVNNNYDQFVKKNHKPWQHLIQKWQEQCNHLTLGVACYGYYMNTQYFITKDLKKYFAEIDRGNMPMEKKAILDERQVKLRKFIFNLKMKHSQFDINCLENVKDVIDVTKSLEKNKLVNLVNGKHVKITNLGKFFVDHIQRTYITKVWNIKS